jgi:hypothetical protein
MIGLKQYWPFRFTSNVTSSHNLLKVGPSTSKISTRKVFLLLLFCLCFCWLAGSVTSAHAEKRVALVIGNDRYPNLSLTEQLQKAANDARSVGAALKQIGFEVVSGENLGRQALLAHLDAAAQRVAPGDTAFFFFSGHGIAVDGTNYILPADVPAIAAGQIASLTGAAIREEDITSRFIRAGAFVTVVVLDACRNNPFTSLGTKGIGGEKGLAPHEPPSGVFTLYAASRGETALDRLYDGDRNPNSVFTRALLPALLRPGLDLPGLALEVRKDVTRLARGVNHTQRPAYYDETSGDRIFLSGAAPSNDRPTQPQLPVPPPPTVSAALPPPRLPGCLVRIFQYPTTPQGTTRYDEISATEFRETGLTNNAEAEIAFREGGRAWTDANILKSKRAGGRCPQPTFLLSDPTHNIP